MPADTPSWGAVQPESEDSKLIDVLTVLNVPMPGDTHAFVCRDDNLVLKKHLLQLHEIVEKYREKGHFLKKDARQDNERRRLQEAKQAQALFTIFNKAGATPSKQAGLVFKTKKGKKLSYGLELASLGFQIAGFILSTIAASHVDVGLPVQGMNSANPISWGYVNALGGVVQGIAEIRLGNKTEGTAMLLSSTQLITATVLTHVGKAAGLLTAASAGGIMAGSFTLCMLTAWGIERNQARIANQRIKLLEEELAKVREAADLNPDKIEHLEYAILLEKANRQNHLRQATSWKWSAGVMLTATVVSVLALSTLSLGAVPAISAGIAALAILTTMVRRWWANSVDHTSFAQKARDNNQLAELDGIGDQEIQFDDGRGTLSLKTPIKIGWGPFKQTKTFGEVLKEMLFQDYQKANKLIIAFKGRNAGPFLEALEEKGRWTLGNKFANALMATYGEKEEPEVTASSSWPDPDLQTAMVSNAFPPG